MNHSHRVAVYPGTFDPITKGHLDIIMRSAALVDRLIVAVAYDITKPVLFSFDERVEMAKHEVSLMTGLADNVEVIGFKGLLIDFVGSCKSNLIVRGLRAVSDYEYEFQLFSSNCKLVGNIETIFLPAKDDTHFISATMVKEIARLNGNVSNFVSSYVRAQLAQKYSRA